MDKTTLKIYGGTVALLGGFQAGLADDWLSLGAATLTCIAGTALIGHAFGKAS